MSSKRYLIVNADDFGRDPGVNRGILGAHERGIVTSASLMVRWPAAAEAVARSRELPDLGLGLHLDLGEWTCRGDVWVPLYEVVPLDDAGAVADEATRQLATFRRLVGKDPTHLDSHQHVHRDDPARAVLAAMARALDVPLRHVSPIVRHRGDFYGQTAKGSTHAEAITVGALLMILATLPPGITELGCHPGDGDHPGTCYGAERAAEVRTLCDPRVRAAIAAEGIELCSFGALAGVGACPAGAPGRPAAGFGGSPA